MDTEPSREEFPNEKAYQGLLRLLDAQRELNHGSWLGAMALSPRQKEGGIFWILLAMDPLIEAYDKLPQELKVTFPDLPPQSTTPPGDGILACHMEKLKRVCSLFAVNEGVVIQALKKVW